MKIDWKQLAQSPGYKSLKAAYIATVRGGRSFDSKPQLYARFRRVLDLAQHHSIRTGVPIDEILNAWEEKRTYSWVSFYGSTAHGISKLPSGKPRNVRPMRSDTYLRQGAYRDPIRKFKRIREERRRTAQELRERLGKKPRMSSEVKKRYARHRRYLNK